MFMNNKLFSCAAAGVLMMAAVLTLGSCSKGQYQLYKSPGNIYFNFNDGADSVVYTFAFTPGRLADTVWLPVQISGFQADSAREYALAVTDSNTTAIADVHYAPLQPYYIMPANTGIDSVPIIVYNTDSLLKKRSVALNVHLVATGALGVAIADMTTAKVIISNKLEEPVWWNMWIGQYFSSTEYQLFIIATGGLTTLSTVGTDAPKNLYYVSLLTNLLQDPFTWVAANPQSGYVLTQLPDGNYHFYNINNPSSFILLGKDATTGTYFFIDENGGEIQ